jgi:hypothetical protein
MHAEILAMKFNAGASALIWVPANVDPHGASVLIGFDGGILRKVLHLITCIYLYVH